MPRVSSHPAGQPVWLDLSTPDAEAARRFYGAVLGWEFDIGGPETGGYAMCRVGDAFAAGIGQQAPDQQTPPAWTVYFGVEDADAAVAAIEGAGGATLVPTMNVLDFGRLAICQDPTGAVFGLWQPVQHVGAGIVDEDGAMAWCEVNTRDSEAAVRFYNTVFGLTAQRTDSPETTYYMLSNGAGPVAGVLQMTAEWGDLPPHWMAYFRVPNAEAAKRAVEANGGQVPYGPFDTPYGRILVVIDPQGAAVSFIAPIPAT